MASRGQTGFFDSHQPKSTEIAIKDDHELVILADSIDWLEQIQAAHHIRASKVKVLCGPEPRYRELLGAITLMAIRNITYRQAEDLIAHYAPARYLCGLMDSTWRPDHVTIFEFTQMMGPEGMDILNRNAILRAQSLGLLDASRLMSDTTAQEAMIPYPNEVGLMRRFTELVTTNLKKVGGKFEGIKRKAKEIASKVKGLVRRSHLFAKTKEEKRKVGKKLYHTVRDLQQLLDGVTGQGYGCRTKAGKEIERLCEVMDRLMPQILYFLQTGFVAAKKIIHLQAPELYSVVRGKAGKSVEFGLKWGINRVDGFVLGFLINNGAHLSDQKFCIQAIKEHIELFGEAPRAFGFDRGGYSKINIKRAKKLGVRDVGIAPTGKAKWSVSENKAERIRRERAQVEGSIGTAKSKKYGFNKPDAKSTPAMETYGHRSFLGMNLMKMVRELTALQMQTA
jgi:transposase, IS5 family